MAGISPIGGPSISQGPAAPHPQRSAGATGRSQTPLGSNRSGINASETKGGGGKPETKGGGEGVGKPAEGKPAEGKGSPEAKDAGQSGEGTKPPRPWVAFALS